MSALLLLTILWPLLLLALRASSVLLILAPLPGLLAALFCAGDTIVFDAERLRFTLALDAPSAVLLGAAALLWMAAGAYAAAYLGPKPNFRRFTAWWLVTQAGSLGVFVSGDLVSFYLTYAMVSLAAYGLVIHDRTARAWRAGSIYLLLTVIGEILLLTAFALLAFAGTGPSLAIRDVMTTLPDYANRDVVIGVILAGFGLKAGLFLLHVWLPLAHPAAPMPASAVLSGVIVKAGIIGLIRFLPFDHGLVDWGEFLGALGFLTAFYGVAIGVTQSNPKTILAYSTVSQMGVVSAALGFGLAAAQTGAPLAAAFAASHHLFAKGALFLAVGVAYATARRRAWPVLLPVLLLVLSFGGFPLTGGAFGKAALKDQLGAGMLGWLSAFSAAGTTVLMLHFARHLRAAMPEEGAPRPAGMVVPWLAMTLAALVLPAMLYAPLGIGPLGDALKPAELWKALWPVLLGGAGALALKRVESRLPRIPEGDVLVLEERAYLSVSVPFSAAIDRAEAELRAWPHAGLALLLLVVGFGAALLAAR
ncbi:proton-conducting transporter membrane subunit [Roseococcus sp. YIM B11640]|uniref:proton-conducting transporter transmembrane domain-containing protein n=1 Tax=Roseococcus sp. YIM B11640 TaxID=3133973 RepID=UPI003C7A2292